MDAWALSEGWDSPGQNDEYIFLLSMADRSGVLRLSNDATEIVELGEDSTYLDLRYRTIAAARHRDWVFQVTERSIVLSNGISV